MKTRFLSLLVFLGGQSLLANTIDNDPIAQIKEVATQFIELVDVNDAEKLKPLFHPTMIQYVQLGGQLIPMSGTDFIQMVADKKLGGHPRKMEIESAKLLRGQAAEVAVHAVSEEYDFMYYLSLAKDGDKWVIVSILTDVSKA